MYSCRTCSLLTLASLTIILYNNLDYLRRKSQLALDLSFAIIEEWDFLVSIDPSEIKFLLWTNSFNRTKQYLILGNISSVHNSGYNFNNPTKIVFHGFSDHPEPRYIRGWRDAYLDRFNCNFISVDWSLLARGPWLPTVVKNTREVGRQTARLIHFLISNGATFDQFHVFGASIGAQCAAQTGRFTLGKIARITGLDPCGPNFHVVNERDRLDPTDAKFVDVIHSAGRWVAASEPLGHVDFYPNGGMAIQPGCEEEEFVELRCSHFKSINMFRESIPANSTRFYALQCPTYQDFLSGACCINQSIAVMGDPANHSTRGIFFLKTNRSKPHQLPMKESINCV